MHNKTEKGQVLLLMVFGLVGLIALTGLAIDGGNAFSDRRQAQNAADAAALAAAMAKANNDAGFANVGYARAASNDYQDDALHDVTVVSPPTSGFYAGNSEYVQVTITSTVETYFAPIVGVNTVTNLVQAVARGRPATTQPIALGNAIVALRQSGCSVVWSNGGPTVRVEGGGIFVNSSDPDCAFRQNGSGTLTAPSMSIAAGGGATYDSGHVILTDPVIHSVPPISDIATMFDGIPTPTCDEDAELEDGVWSAGNVDGSDLSGDVTLSPGIYCIEGDWISNGNDDISGEGVLLYMKNGELRWNGNGALRLSAMTTGDYAGLLIYQPWSNTNPMTINGNNNNELVGTIIAPHSDVYISGTAAANGLQTQVVGYTVQFGGNGLADITYDDEQQYDLQIPPSVELTE